LSKVQSIIGGRHN